ncbi:Polyprenyl synthetase [[Clostridium] ultunense Esp]|uniref:Farnesyl diphosphate synthase n=1 Tax=[Clostridium] ultunense Esp TaxID=1288971 RepID=M1ZKT4_9FIRM|nr:farnesyl diphosphate synthase [Schnuerera ultunensis]CCQ96007.1 Polyprenyl synthetase [[Clostridium] ultunense Esp]SHD77155.1 geranyltranstransferase [[Clostridium] ultunense Esp]
MLINEELEYTKDIIDKNLSNLLKNKIGYQKKIFESINYSLFTGGKRLRPILLLKSCEMLGGEHKRSIPFAMAIEMIHTYSLIHDDLPSMDDDDFRRGRLTNHKVYGEAIAVLSGDGLLNLAFEIMVDFTLKNSKTIEDYKRNIWAIDEIGKYSGIYGMIGGQVVDLLSNEIAMDEDKLLFMYKSKTAALIQASLVAGAILGGGCKEDIERMRRFGLYLGLAYQIRDDILDVNEDKSINKVTYLSFNNIDVAKDKVDELSKKAIDVLDYYENKDVEFFKKLTYHLMHRDY